MKYALSLNEDKRIMSACIVLPKFDYTGMAIVDSIPDGNMSDHLYVDGRYVYDPLPDPEPVAPQPSASVWDELDAAYQRGVDSV